MDAWHRMIQRIWSGIADFLATHAGAVLAVTLVISVALAFGASRLTFATGQDSYLNDDSQISIDNVEYQDLFGGEAMITAFEVPEGQSIVDLFTSENIEEFDRLQAELTGTPGVLSSISPVSALRWSDDLVTAPPGRPSTESPAGQILQQAIVRAEPEADDVAARTEDALTTLQRADAAGEPRLDNPAWVEFLLFDNQGTIRAALRPFFPTPVGVEPIAENATRAQMVTRLDGNQALSEQSDAATAVEEAFAQTDFPPAAMLTTGAPVLLKDINDYLQGGMLVLGAVAIVIMIVVLAAAFRVRWRLTSLVVMLAGVLWCFGILGYSGFELSLVTIAGLPILIGLGVDFAIQVHNRIEEEVLLDKESTPFVETLRNLGPPLAVATVAGVIACLSLLASQVPMIRDFGVLLALGIVMEFAAAVIIPVAVIARRERRSPTTVYHEQPLVERTMTGLGKLPQWTVVPLMVLTVGLFALGLALEDQTPIQTDPQRWVDQESQVVADLDELAAQTGTSSELAVYIRSDDVFTDEIGEFVTDLGTTELERFPETLITASGLPMTVYYLMNFPGVTPLPPTGEDLRAAYDVAPPEIKEALVAADGTAANLTFRVGPSSLVDRKAIVDDISLETSPEGSLTPPEGISATPAGLAVVGVGLLESLTDNRLLLTMVALVGVAIWLVIRLASLVKAALIMVPVLLAVGAASTLVYLTGITVSPLTTVSGPLVIAICTEFTVLIMFRHLEERRQGLSPEEAVKVATARTGRAFFASALTTIGGFAVLLFSPLPLLSDFGAIVALTVAIALISAIAVLPPILIWADRHEWVTPGRGARPVDPSVPLEERASARAPI